VVGKVNDGWSVAMATLTFERGSTSANQAMDVLHAVEDVITLAKERTGPDGKRPAYRDDEIAVRLAKLRAEAAALRALMYEYATRGTEGARAGAESALIFLFCAELQQKVRETAIDILGPAALEMSGPDGRWARLFLNDRLYTIAGGTSEVRRNLIAEKLCNLPRSY
jgi:alkylation response protein AidB-like acyl-CoA dehydrogenase